MKSLPSPPKRRSESPRPIRVSLPPRPRSVSFSAVPTSLSGPLSPVRLSARAAPALRATIIAATVSINTNFLMLTSLSSLLVAFPYATIMPRNAGIFLVNSNDFWVVQLG
ncbi:hypothetical protein GBA63_01135 [Rubrobacter tropicus]|uniref:Uncharacterized protein n=1 Tax=Rubrobacter tropicus TaxID=2653851 RepID=A0A6G8Q4H8_9ACTN|nr:hypothetical protein GBA63_01135 [Rubrobacter tropicus]